MKYRAKPLLVDAIPARDAIRYAGKDWNKLPDWLKQAYEEGAVFFSNIYVSMRSGSISCKAFWDDMILYDEFGNTTIVPEKMFVKMYEEVMVDWDIHRDETFPATLEDFQAAEIKGELMKEQKRNLIVGTPGDLATESGLPFG